MNFKNSIKLALLILLTTAALFADTPSPGMTRQVRASQYCDFLNQAAMTNLDQPYDAHMGTDPNAASVVRLGEPGAYSYRVIAGRENFPVTYVSSGNKVSYLNCLQEGLQATGFRLEEENEKLDSSLRSNQSGFTVDDSTDEKQLSLAGNSDASSSNGSFFKNHSIIVRIGVALYSLFVAREIWKASPSFEEMKIAFRSPNAPISDEEAMLLFNRSSRETQRAILATRGYSETQIESFFASQTRDPSGREPDSTTWFSNIRLWGLGGNAQERRPLMSSRNTRESARSSTDPNQQLRSQVSLNESQSLDQQQQALLDSLEQSTTRVRDYALAIQDEVREQNDILDLFLIDVDIANETVRDVNVRLTSPEIKNRNNCFKNVRIKAVICSEVALLYYIIKQRWFEN